MKPQYFSILSDIESKKIWAILQMSNNKEFIMRPFQKLFVTIECVLFSSIAIAGASENIVQVAAGNKDFQLWLAW